jgi:hypothetical protein
MCRVTKGYGVADLCAGASGTVIARKGNAMPKSTEQLFAEFVHFAATHGYGAGYQRDPRQAVPLDCVFVRFRSPGGGLYTSAGIVQFRQREDGFTACQTFVERSDDPLELQMNFPGESPRTFASPTFAEAQALTQSRWRRWTHAVGGWWR